MIVDIHNHILPKMDDGARDFGDTLLMARQAIENGITHIIATPHHRNGVYLNESEAIIQKVEEINRFLHRRDLSLEIIPGMEVHLYGELASDLKKIRQEVLPLNCRKYVLVELPYTHIPHYTSAIFYEMQLLDYIPIIAHPERNAEIKKHPNLLHNLIQKGALSQVTAGSIAGLFGKKSQSFSLKLLKHNLAHFVASDAHNTVSRSFQLLSAYNTIDRELSLSYKEYLIENATHVLTGTEFPPYLPIRFQRRKIYNLFGGGR